MANQAGALGAGHVRARLWRRNRPDAGRCGAAACATVRQALHCPYVQGLNAMSVTAHSPACTALHRALQCARVLKSGTLVHPIT